MEYHEKLNIGNSMPIDMRKERVVVVNLLEKAQQQGKTRTIPIIVVLMS